MERFSVVLLCIAITTLIFGSTCQLTAGCIHFYVCTRRDRRWSFKLLDVYRTLKQIAGEMFTAGLILSLGALAMIFINLGGE